jgi:predicted nucleic-acid-binding Zn-ribbon protein
VFNLKPNATCPNCTGTNVYSSGEISAGGGYAPNYLPGLEKYWRMVAAKFCVVVCTDCGLARWFASDEAVSRIPESSHWRKV